MERKVKQDKIISALTIIMILMQLFIPYTNISYAATYQQPSSPAFVFLKSSNIKDDGVNKYFTIDIAQIGDWYCNSFDIKFSYDKTKIEPANKSTHKTGTSLKTSMDENASFNVTYSSSTSYLDRAAGTIRIIPNMASADAENPEDYGPDKGYDAYMSVFTIYFRLVDTSLTDDDITADLFAFVPTAATEGFKFGYVLEDGGKYSPTYIIDTSYVKFDGFAEPAKTVDSISIKQNPTKTTYDHGDAISLDGGKLTVNYSDGSSEEISMTDSNVSIVSGTPADVNNPQVKIKYGGKEATFNITVNDPVQKLTVKSPINTLEYTHNDTIDFTGLKLEAEKKSGAVVSLDANSTGITISETVASVNSPMFTQTSTAEDPLAVKGTQKIKFTYEGKEATQTIIVNDTIDTIALKSQPSKVVYKRGETLDLSGAVVEVTLGSGNKTDINLPDGSINVSAYSPTTVGSKQNLKVSVGEKTATDTINVEAYNYITSSTIKTPTDTNPNYNTDLNLSGGKMTLMWQDSSTTSVNLSDPSITIKGYDKTTKGLQEITAEYSVIYKLSDGTEIPDKITNTFNVDVQNPVKSIAITPPTKTTYKHGESLNLADGTITVTYADGTTDKVAMTESMITDKATGITVNMSPAASDYTVDNKVEKTLTIKYTEDEKTETIDYPITIINDVQSISVFTKPKTKYNVNDTLDITNGEIQITRATGTKEVISMSEEGVTVGSLDTTTAGTKAVAVSYTENGITKDTSYDVTVTDTVKSIAIKSEPNKTTYKYDEELDPAGGTIEVTKGSGTTTVDITAGMISGYDKTKLGEQEVTVTYGQDANGNPVTATFKVNVKDYVTGITINPASVTGKYNDELSTLINNNDIKYTVTYAKAGAKTPVALTKDMVTGYDKTNMTAQNLTVTYTDNDENSYTNGQEFTATLNINLSNSVSKIEIKAPVNDTKFNYGDTLTFKDGAIRVTYADGTTKNVDITDAMVTDKATGAAVNMKPAASEFTSGNKTTKTLTITYTEDGKTGTKDYPITIINDVESIAVFTKPKTKYNVNDTLDITNGEIQITRAVGDPEVISMSEEGVTVGSLDTTTAGTKAVTVSYTENGVKKDTSYNVTVTDTVKSIAIKSEPNKTTYKYNEELDPAGATIEVTKGSGITTLDITSDMITGYDKTKLGEQEVTVTYGQDANENPVTATFKVTVQDYVTGITLNPTSVSGKYNDEISTLINDNNITYTVMYAKAGAQTPVALDGSMVTGYDKTSLTAQSLTVKYTDNDANSYTNGTDFPATLNVTLQDEVISINVGTMPKQNYQYGESLDVSTGTLNIVKDSGTVTIPITESMVTEADGSPFNSRLLETRDLTVTYGQDANGNPVTTTYEVTVSDFVLGIILIPPTKVTYEYGESLELSGGSVQKVMASNAATTPVALSDSSVTLSTFDNTRIGAQTINVTYEGKTESFGVVVEDNIQSIAMKNTPKTIYKYGEALDVTSGTIEATRSSGTKEVINITNSMVTGFEPQKLGIQTLTVKHGDKITSYDVEVQDYMKDIEITKPSKLIYNIGDTIDLTGGQVKPVMASGTATTQIEMTNSQVTISGFDTTTEGAKTITVTYQGITKTFGITVVDSLNEVILSSLPDKTEYLYGESLDVTGATLTAKKASGESQVINVTKDMVTGYNPKKLGEQTLTVTYEGFTQQFKVNVNDYISSLKIQKPTKTEYEYGENLDLTGGKVSVIMASGKVNETVEMTASMTSGFDSKQTGTQTIQVEYKDLQGKFQVNVTDKVKGISLNTEPNKVKYEYGENLDITGATITVIKSSGIITVDVTKDMVSGYNPQTPGTQLITVTYAGFTTKFIVNVGEKPEEPEQPAQEPEQKEPEKVVTPVKPNKTPITENNTTITENTPIQELVQEPEQPVKPNDNTTQTTEEKPAEILETKDEGISEETVAVIIGGLGLLFLILLLVFKRNVKIYVVEDGEFVLGGTDKIKSKNPKLDIDQYLDGETYNNKVKIRLSDSISEKLDGKEIEIKHRGKKIKHKVVYNDEPYEIILK